MNSESRQFKFHDFRHDYMYVCLTIGTVLGLIISHAFVLGQAVTIQTEPAKVEYYRMPDEPLDAAYETYTAAIDIPFRELSKTDLSEMSLVDQYLQLEGYKKVNNQGDIEIKASIGDFTNWGEFRKTSRNKSKDKDGNERTILKYYMEVKYSLAVSILVRNRQGERLLDKYIFSHGDTRTWISPSYANSSDLDSYWRIQRADRLKTLHKERIQEGMKQIAELINTKFGYRLIRETVRFETIGKKKHPEHDIFLKNTEILKTAFSLMDADKSLEEVKKKTGPALTFYQTAAPKYKTGNKDQEKLKHICLFNLALAYYWLEEFDQAENYAKAIQKFDTKDKDARRLLADIEYTRTSLYRANRTSRHGR